MKKTWGMALLLLLMSANAWGLVSTFEKGLVEIRPGYKLYVEIRKAEVGKPTIFCLNGLTWSTRDWKPLVEALDKIEPGLGFVLYDMKGMGDTLLINPPVRENIHLEDQLKDLEDLRRTLRVSGPTAAIGLSYGGGLALMNYALNPKAFDKVIAISPFLARITDQDNMINDWVRTHRIMFPLDPRTVDELYDHYLRVLVYSTYPLAEPVVLENPYKLEAIYRMVLGAKNFRAKDFIPGMKKGQLHIVGAIDDQFVKDPELQGFWQTLAGKGMSYLRLSDTGHKIPTERPELTANWIREILRGNPELNKGLQFDGDAVKGEARSGEIVIPLKKVSFCETLLRRTFGAF